jgi:HAD superfamily hydrolase (TIGR01509 family)
MATAVERGRTPSGSFQLTTRPAAECFIWNELYYRAVADVAAAGNGIEAVIFDMDGVLVESEEIWDEARRELALERGLAWPESAQREMMGMSSLEWSRYMHERIGLEEPPEQISIEVVRRIEELYEQHVPLLDGAVQAVERMAARFRLGLASSSNRPIIDLVLELAGLARHFEVTVSSEEVARGKPAPDVYLEALRRMAVAPERAAAIEDSTNGILSAHAAGVFVVAVPSPVFPPRADALAASDVVLDSLVELTPALLVSA